MANRLVELPLSEQKFLHLTFRSFPGLSSVSSNGLLDKAASWTLRYGILYLSLSRCYFLPGYQSLSTSRKMAFTGFIQSFP